LPELRNHAHFSDLSNAIAETLTDVEDRLSRVDQIFVLLGEKTGFEYCQGVIGLMGNAFSAIQQQEADPGVSYQSCSTWRTLKELRWLPSKCSDWLHL
jgi:ferritin-like metal-binding protein YciE